VDHVENPEANETSSLTDLWTEREILAEAQELGSMGTWAWDITTGKLWWSDTNYRLLGLDPEESTASLDAFMRHVHPDDRDRLQHGMDNMATQRGLVVIDYRLLLPNGEIRHVQARGRVTDVAGSLRMIGLLRDLTEEVTLQEERDAAVASLADSEERYRLLAENAWDVIWTMELDGSISYVSPAVERMRGITPEEAMAQTPEQIQPPESVAKGMEYYARLFKAIAEGTEPPTFHGEQEYYRKDGSIMIGELDVIPQVNKDGVVRRILGVTRDISERKQLEIELNRLAVTDALTGAWNRRHGELLLASDLAEVQRYGGPALSLLMLDIDHFKSINDTCGHQAGDRVLIELTHRISENLRASDVLVRWGGEEFIIVLRHCSIDDALPLAEKIRALVDATPCADVGSVTVSIGAAEFRKDDDLAGWMRRADRAMYEAKAAGRNAVRSGG
jgi:diguanylate cyclase (GGDEF)-like protein/PAS domain S-box-containing protein